MKPYKIVVFTLSCSKDYYSCNCCVMNQFLFFFFHFEPTTLSFHIARKTEQL